MGGTADAWSRVGSEAGVAELVAAVLRLDAAGEYTRKELSEAADVTYRELYLGDAVETVVDMGLLDRREAEPEPTFSPASDHPAYAAARAFADAAESDPPAPDVES